MHVLLSCDHCLSAKANGALMSYEMKDQLEEAAVGTSKALSAVRRTRPAEEEDRGATAQLVSIDDMLADKTKDKDDKKISHEIAVMQPILRFLQLLCENHNRDLQVR